MGLVRIVEAVDEDHTILGSGIIERMPSLFWTHADYLDTGLNATEQALLCLMVEGWDNGQLSETLSLDGQREME